MFENMFLSQHPEYKLVETLVGRDLEVLLWAQEEGYIMLRYTPKGGYVYKEKDLSDAYMWFNKIVGVSDDE